MSLILHLAAIIVLVFALLGVAPLALLEMIALALALHFAAHLASC